MAGGSLFAILVAWITPLFVIGLIVFLSALQPLQWTPPVLWTNQFGNPRLGNSVTSIAANGNSLYVAGFSSRIENLGLVSSGELFLSRYSSSGSVEWTHQFLDSSGNSPSISVGSDGVYFAANGPGTGTLLRYDFSGNLLWNESANPGIDLAPSLPVANVLFGSGVSDHPITNQTLTGSTIMFLREYDAGGRVVWTSEFSNSTTDRAQGISVSNNAVYMITKTSIVAYSLNGHQEWILPVEGSGSIIPYGVSADSTGVYVTGTATNITYGVPIGFLERYDANGRLIWNSTFASPDYGGIAGEAVSEDSSGIYVSIGSFPGHDFIIKFDSKGQQVWTIQTQFTSLNYNFLIASGQGNFYVAGAVSTLPGYRGILEGVSGDSSFVFFGVNPPYSFMLVAAAVALVIIGLLLLQRKYTRKTTTRVQYKVDKQVYGRIPL